MDKAERERTESEPKPGRPVEKGFTRIPPIDLCPLPARELEKSLDEIRYFETLTTVVFADPDTAIRASTIFDRYGPYVCYGATLYGVSSLQQLSALEAEGIAYRLHQQ